MRGNGTRHRLAVGELYFNSRLCMRGNGNRRKPVWLQGYFNSRLCMRGNGKPDSPGAAYQHISIHASAWEATGRCGKGMVNSLYFNSRLCMRGNAYSADKSKRIHIFQFTPLHERQQVTFSVPVVQESISIHASAWEATALPCRLRFHNHFNSRLCMRGNLFHDYFRCINCISIHASAWEATAKIHNLFDKIYIIFYQTLFFL